MCCMGDMSKKSNESIVFLLISYGFGGVQGLEVEAKLVILGASLVILAPSWGVLGPSWLQVRGLWLILTLL